MTVLNYLRQTLGEKFILCNKQKIKTSPNWFSPDFYVRFLKNKVVNVV